MELTLVKNNIVDQKGIKKFVKEVRKILFKEVFQHLSIKHDLTITKHLFKKYISSDNSKSDIFFSSLENLKVELIEDLHFFFESDPANNGIEEIIITYPGYYAILLYRIAHILYTLDLKIHARVITEIAHKKTGIDIHPGATIASPFFIDHGTGVVIGETSIINRGVKIYQGVTLGALSLKDGYKMKGTKRHPTIGSNVTIYAGASILGGDVVIGDNVVIGSNVFLTESIPDNHKVVMAKPELIVERR